MHQKIALCFLTYGDLSQPTLWKNFLESNSNYNIYIHNKYPIENDYFKKYSIKNKIDTKCGDISLVKATLLLFKTAFEDFENEYFILLSDKCIPLYNSDLLYQKIYEFNSNIVSCHKCKINIRFENMKNKNFILKDNFKQQDQWMLLVRNTVDYFLKHDYLNEFGDQVFAIDEHYFVNIMREFNIPFLNKKITYVHWDMKIDHQHPKTFENITEDLLKEILEKDYLFIRKIKDTCCFTNKFIKHLQVC